LQVLASNSNSNCCGVPRGRSFASLRHHYDDADDTAADVDTRMNRLIPTLSDSRYSIPLTVSDVHLRHEQLPFAYFFRETLDEAKLESSLRNVLQHFPILGGRLACNRLAIQCDPDDSVPYTVGDIDISLDDWLRKRNQNHSHKSASGYPTLLPLFDALFQNNHHAEEGNDDDDDDDDGSKRRHHSKYKYENLLKIRVTYFKGGGTAIGVNMNHVLGDTASCVRFVRCWGREMRKEAYPLGACNIRANASCSGMMTSDLADLMGLNLNKGPIPPSFWTDFYNEFVSSEATISDDEKELDLPPVVNHEYVDLSFPPHVLNAMKTYGMATCDGPTSYISTNDMMTACGWLLKRSLSDEDAYNISMVVNLRGRCGVDAFGDMNNVNESDGLFGNGITNVVAAHPPTTGSIGMSDIATAAIAIRVALVAGLLEVPDRIAESKRGTPTPAMNSSLAFSTTSWGQFPVWKIRFSEEQLTGFHGHPSFPLPTGRTFSSVISPALTGGCTYKLLLPSDKADEARALHAGICTLFLGWQTDAQAAV
jgi:hypothetical protein